MYINMGNYKKLKNPPIKECVIGIGIKNYFNHDLKEEPIYNEIQKIYPKISETTKNDIKIKGKDIETQAVSNGYRFSSESNKEHIFIEKNRVAFADTNKYENFDIFFSKFDRLLNIVRKYLPIESIEQIALKYVNHIILDQDEVVDKQKIKFLPNFAVLNKDKLFAKLIGFGGNYILQSEKYTNIKALVNSSLQFIGENPKLQVVFNIDTIADVTKEKISSNNSDKIAEYILKLKDFKNEIFFANVDDDIKEFNK